MEKIRINDKSLAFEGVAVVLMLLLSIIISFYILSDFSAASGFLSVTSVLLLGSLYIIFHQNKYQTFRKSNKQNRIEVYRKCIYYISRRNGILYIKYDVKKNIFIRLSDDADAPIHEIPLDFWFNNFHPEDIEKGKELLNKMHSQQVNTFHTEYRYRYPDVYNWFSIDVAAYEYEKNHLPLNYICMVHNIEKEKREIANIMQLRNEAEAANKMKTAFIESLNHEIRTPLNAIQGFSELILNNQLTDADAAIYKNIIHNNIQILLDIANESINISLIESGFMKVNPTPFQLRPFLEELVESFRLRLRKGVVLNINGTDNILVQTDKLLLQSIVSCLVMNANKFTQEGSITISYRKEKCKLIISVADTGIGIAIEDQERIFARFEKVDSFTSGIGLGLSLAQSMVKKMGGEIGVVSSLGHGSTFWISIPKTCLEL